jgi:hypothetical protein
MKRGLIILFLGIFLMGSVSGATYNYYFSDDNAGNPEGSDNNPCTQALPCKSFNKAENLANAAGPGGIL